VGDAASKLEHELTDAQKSLVAYKACTNDARAQKYAEAVAEARKGLALYPNSSLNNLCILNVYAQQKAGPDSIITVASAIRAIDSTSAIALANLGDAYQAKHDTANAIDTYLALARLDPSPFGGYGSYSPAAALQIVDSLIAQNPADVNMLRTKWLLQLRAKQYKGALATGAAMVNADTTRADIDYFQRSIAAAGLDSNRAMQQQLIAQAMQKFGDRVPVEFPLVSAQIYCEAGQFQQALARARRASEIDSKKVAAWQLQLSIRNQMNQPDSAVATAQKAIAAGVPKDTLGALLLWQVGAAVKKAEDTKDQPRAAWEAALTSAQQADAILPSQGTKFYVGVAAFQVGLDALQKAQSLGLEARKPGANGKDTFAQACSETMLAEHQWRTVAKAFPAGDAFNKERAAEIYGDMRRQSRSIPQMKKRFCKRK
ncbi:MAG TPA: hypothetical protein VH277_16490, partial [Gemmatimonadaceae bacterium]|nr:hypothetical protein [Gemmatimonadaceae bacterium]